MACKHSVTALDFEVIVYRKGSLQAHIDLKQGYVTWRDSWQWCNNFTRTITEDQVQKIVNLIESEQFLKQVEQYKKKEEPLARPPEEPELNPVSWAITLYQESKKEHIRGNGSIFDGFLPLKELVEQVSRVCFFI
jgi:hypothetical protein